MATLAEGVDFTLMFALGLASSLHCVTMCGPIIVVASAPFAVARPGSPPRWVGLVKPLLYHAGRGVTYAIVGGALAGAGVVVEALFPSRLVGGLIQVSVGSLLVLVALLLAVRGQAVSVPTGDRWLARTLRTLVSSRRGWSLLTLGLLTGLLPCGVLYAALARCVAAGSPLVGAGLMLAFWLGTVPLLVGVGVCSTGVFRSLGRYATALIVVAMLATGGWLVLKGGRTLATGSTSAQPRQHAQRLDRYTSDHSTPTPNTVATTVAAGT